MKNTYYLAIDIGASSGRHIVGRLEDGKIKLKEVYRFANGAKHSGGHLVWNAARLEREVLNGLRAAAGQGYKPDFIGIDTWAVDYALLDADGEIMGDIYSYRDGRTQKAAEAVHRHVSFEQLYKTTGIQYQPFNTIYQLFADKRGGKLERASYFLMLPDYLNYRLTGVKKTGIYQRDLHGHGKCPFARLGRGYHRFIGIRPQIIRRTVTARHGGRAA